ncbi:ABC transporter permease [Falsiroseomonas oryzae]|uniref:ABC transporter permease n=1 Tax=Falsiroseomonas oryzae TaxID=2766473 RepID=UPI0022EA71FA|nr:ABC transporter permease [Roseomonas sp. MO-31]
MLRRRERDGPLQSLARSSRGFGPWRIPRRALVGVATIGVALLLWWLATSGLRLLNPLRLPSPQEVWAAFTQISSGQGYGGATLWQHAAQSLWLVAKGFTVAVITGVPLGLLMGWSRRAETLINPIFLLLRPIPALAWIPLAIVWFGLGDTGKVFVIWLTAFVPSVINAFTGVRNVDPVLIAAARTQGASTAQVIRHVVIPGAMPLIFTGLRLSLQASWTTLVAAELVGAFFGLGRVLNVAGQDIFPGMILVGMAAVAVCGAVTTWLLGRVERRVLAWRPAV